MGSARGKSALWKRTQHRRDSDTLQVIFSTFQFFNQFMETRETLSFWTWDSQTGININIVMLAVNVLLFWAVLIFTELNITKLLWIKMKEMVYGSKVSMPNNVDSDVKLEKDTVFQVQEITYKKVFVFLRL